MYSLPYNFLKGKDHYCIGSNSVWIQTENEEPRSTGIP